MIVIYNHEVDLSKPINPRACTQMFIHLHSRQGPGSRVSRQPRTMPPIGFINLKFWFPTSFFEIRIRVYTTDTIDNQAKGIPFWAAIWHEDPAAGYPILNPCFPSQQGSPYRSTTRNKPAIIIDNLNGLLNFKKVKDSDYLQVGIWCICAACI